MMLSELLNILGEFEKMSDHDLPVYFESGQDISGVAFGQIVCPADEPTLMIY